MARPSSAPGATHSLEWVVGLEPLPTPVGDDHPEILLLLAGGVVDFHLGPPGALLERAAQHLHDALAKAERDGAQRPTSIRVRSAQLAAALGASEPPLPTIACAATPEIDAAVAEMASRLAHDEPSYLSVDIEPKHVAAFFAAAARLYRAAPWSSLPSGTRVLDTDALGAQGAVASLVGRTAAQFSVITAAGPVHVSNRRVGEDGYQAVLAWLEPGHSPTPR